MSGIEKRTVAEQLSSPRPARRLPDLAPRTGKTIRALCCWLLVFYCLPTKASEPVARADDTAKITFTGRILDTKGQPVAGAKVTLYEIHYGRSPYSQRVTQVQEKTTRADGAYAFAATRDSDAYRESHVLVSKEGLALGWAGWGMQEDQRADIMLGEPTELAGEVVDEAGEPVAGAEVSLAAATIGPEEDGRYFPNRWIASDLLAVKTDAGGRFVFPALPAQASVEFSATSPGRARVCTLDNASHQGEAYPYAPGKTGIRITLPPEARIQGIVVDKASGRPLAGVKLTAQVERPRLPLPQEPSLSGEDGRFSMGGLAAGRYTVLLLPCPDEVAEWAAEPVRVGLHTGQTKGNIKLELVKGGLLEVLVKSSPNGRPVDKASIGLGRVGQNLWVSGRTNAAGLARIRVVPGVYEVAEVYKPGYSRPGLEQQIEVKEGETQHVEYTVAPALRITGVVRDPAGNPLDGVRLAVKPSSSYERTTGPDGKFEIMWDPSWTLPDITSILLARDRARNLIAAVDLNAQMKNLNLKLQPGIVLTGKVLDPEGGPLTGARIRVTLRWPSFGVMLSRNSEATTAPDGTFAVPALPPDRQYGVTVLAEGYGRLYVRVDTHDTKDNRVELGAFKLPVANLSVSGIVVDANDKPVAGAEVFSYGPEQPEHRVILTDDQGRFVIRNICAGLIDLSANVPDAGGPSGSVATEGGATDVKITVSASGESGRYVPRKSASLIDKPLPSLKMAGVELPADANDRMLLVCLWDVSQRPSRHCLTQLAQRATQLGEKGVMIIAVQAARTEEGALAEWVKTNKVPFPVGRMTGDFEKARFDWGATSLPHLILTNRKHVVVAEGFELSVLDERIRAGHDNR